MKFKYYFLIGFVKIIIPHLEIQFSKYILNSTDISHLAFDLDFVDELGSKFDTN